MKFEEAVVFRRQNYINVSANVIETIYLQLRQPTTEDFGVLSNLWRDEKVRQFLGGIISDKEIAAKIVSINKHWHQYGFGQFAVYNKTAKQVIGICGLQYSEDGVEISYMFFPAFWGRGLATEAILASFYYGFSFLKLETIIAITQEANCNSWKLLEKMVCII